MRGRISAIAAGLALAFGGGVAGAALVGGGSGSDSPVPLPLAPPADLAAERSAVESQKIAYAKLHHALKTAQKARRIARRARNKANESLATTTALLDDVDKALADSAAALAAAQDAEADASTALAKVNSTQAVSDAQNGVVGTSEENAWVPLGGPQVNVRVPPSGLIEVWTSVRFGDPVDGMVALFEDGQQVEFDQAQLCTGFGSPLDNAILVGELGPGSEITLSTPPAPLFGAGCGSAGSAAGSILLERPPGPHTYELRYADCGCDSADAEFSERVLRVAPHL